MEELKSCPFCGGEDLEKQQWRTYDARHPECFGVCCTYCGGRGGDEWSEAEAVKTWNRRANDDMR